MCLGDRDYGNLREHFLSVVGDAGRTDEAQCSTQPPKTGTRRTRTHQRAMSCSIVTKLGPIHRWVGLEGQHDRVWTRGSTAKIVRIQWGGL